MSLNDALRQELMKPGGLVDREVSKLGRQVNNALTLETPVDSGLAANSWANTVERRNNIPTAVIRNNVPYVKWIDAKWKPGYIDATVRSVIR